MNRDFASSLIQLNNTFYREHAASFSDTRRAPWPGWVRTMDIALEQIDAVGGEQPVRAFDLACGNMRFEHFALGRLSSSSFAGRPLEFYGVDSCQDLATDEGGYARRIPNLHFQEVDVLGTLMKLNPADMPDVVFDAPLADISVCLRSKGMTPRSSSRAITLSAGKTTIMLIVTATTLTIDKLPTW